MTGTTLLRRTVRLLALGLLLQTIGCGPQWHYGPWWSNLADPSATIARPAEPEILTIYQSINPMDEYAEVYANASMPSPDDLRWTEEEYVLGPGDIIDVGILDLYAEGFETVVRRQVSNAGRIDLPLIEGQLDVGDLTVEAARGLISDAYRRAEILRRPTISITVIAQRQNTFSIIGAVSRPGTYSIVRPEFRLLDALALAGDVTQEKIQYVYVIRQTEAAREQLGPQRRGAGQPAVAPTLPGEEALPGEGLLPGEEPLEPGMPQPGEPDVLEPAAPFEPLEPIVPSEAEPAEALPGEEPGTVEIAPPIEPVEPTAATAETPEQELQSVEDLLQDLGSPEALPDTRPAMPSAYRLAQVSDGPAGPPQAPVFVQGRGWVSPEEAAAAETQPAGTMPATEPGTEVAATPDAGPSEEVEDPFQWASQDLAGVVQILAVDLEKLKQGDPRWNIVIRDNDVIQVPVLEVGEFYVGGEVGRPGVYSLTGRKVTVKMAMIAAGNLSPLAWPSNSVLVRRIGQNQEIMVPLHLDLIMRGQEPDIFLKPDDQILVGTHIAAPFLAVARNAFRMTYGFGFIYDRNYAERNFGQYTEFDELLFR